MAQKVLAHADARVAHRKAQTHPPGPAPHLPDSQPDRAALWGEFYGVGEQIEQNLIQPQPVADEKRTGQVHQGHVKDQPLVLRLGIDDGGDGLHDGFQIEGFMGYLHFSRVDF